MTIRWRGEARKILGVIDLIEDAEGARRAVAEGGWLAVVYPRRREEAFIDALERVPVERELAMAQTEGGMALYVSSLRVTSSVGTVEWRTTASVTRGPVLWIYQTSPLYGILPGELWLPDGTTRKTSAGQGFFDASGAVRGYRPWRDGDADWAVVTEVDASIPEELRPILAALPLLFFTVPPTV